ncbi:MAG TPA: guanylate kinase [Syntrophales bacterium]|nr:guanylate kinase [Syntrophales bacterium]HPC01657.1 guanylate kinase [Syntrophales bacterium]
MYIVVSAPSGTGKTTICRRLFRLCPALRFSVSHTTRPPRPGEVEGRDYFFVSREEFEEMANRGEFLEWACNFGHLYGTSAKALTELMAGGSDVIVDIDPQGARTLKERCPGGVFVFILPPTLEELRNRLARRRSEPPEVIARRFERAKDEIKEYIWYDYVVVNDRLEKAVSHLQAIYQAEKLRSFRMEGVVRGLWEGK